MYLEKFVVIYKMCIFMSCTGLELNLGFDWAILKHKYGFIWAIQIKAGETEV